MTELVTILCLLLISATVSVAQTAVMFRGGPQRLGQYQDSGFLASNRLLWKFHTGGGIPSSPAIQNGLLYVGSNDGYVYCLDVDSGKLIWKFKSSATISSSPALANGLVYFQSSDNQFYAVTAKSGKLKWSYAGAANVGFDGRCGGCASTEEGGWDFWVSSPLVTEQNVFFGSGDANVYALNALTGKVTWRFKTGGRVRASPALLHNTIYVGSLDGKMYALDAADGKLRWSFKTEGNKDFPVGEIQSSAAVADGLVVFGSRDYFLYALDAETGKLSWKTQHEDSWIISSPAIANESVYAGSSDGRFLQKVDLKTGKEIWRAKMSLNVYSSPALTKDFVYAANARGEILALDHTTGKIKAGFLIDESILSSPVVYNGTVFIGAQNGNLYAISSRSESTRKSN